MTKIKNRDLLIRIDEKVARIQKDVAGHNGKIDKLNDSTIALQEQMTNHINLHKRDMVIISAIIGTGLTILTLWLNHFA